MTETEEVVWEWLEDEQEVCSKCGITVLPVDTAYYHCESCRR